MVQYYHSVRKWYEEGILAVLTGEIQHRGVVRFAVTVLAFEDDADYRLQVWRNGREIVSTNASVSNSYLGHSEYYLLAKGFINSPRLIGDRSNIKISSRNAQYDREALPCCVRLDCEKLGSILHCFSRKKHGVVVNTLRVLLQVLDDRYTDVAQNAENDYSELYRVIEFECSFEDAQRFGTALLSELDAAVIDRRERGAPAIFDEFEDPSGYYEAD